MNDSPAQNFWKKITEKCFKLRNKSLETLAFCQWIIQIGFEPRSSWNNRGTIKKVRCREEGRVRWPYGLFDPSYGSPDLDPERVHPLNRMWKSLWEDGRKIGPDILRPEPEQWSRPIGESRGKFGVRKPPFSTLEWWQGRANCSIICNFLLCGRALIFDTGTSSPFLHTRDDDVNDSTNGLLWSDTADYSILLLIKPSKFRWRNICELYQSFLFHLQLSFCYFFINKFLYV